MVKERLTAALAHALTSAREAGALSVDELPQVQLDLPPSPEFGDFSSDVALLLARQTRQTPKVVAEAVAAHLDTAAPPLQSLVDRVAVGGSGFINFHLRPGWLHRVIEDALREGPEYGKSAARAENGALQVEFVSASPTGPLSIQHGRSAVVGDTLAALMEWNGYRVTREFYVNDTGSQMERFTRSLEARYLQAAGHSEARVPADAFSGPHLAELAQALHAEAGDRLAALSPEERRAELATRGRDAVIARQRETLESLGVRFDEWYLERTLHESGKLEEMIALLRRHGHVYDQDGAVWVRTSAFGDTEDRPLLRSNGQPTYIAADLAYHLDKLHRGFDRIIDVWDADHEPYVGRTLAGLRALGAAADAVNVLICQDVSVKLDGQLVDNGNILPLDEVVERAGKDAARFFFLQRSAGQPLELDLDRAARPDADNPYVQLRDALAEALAARRDAPRPDGELGLESLTGDGERALMRKLADYQDELRSAAREMDPCRVLRYAQELAPLLRDVARESGELTAARAALVEAGCIVMQNLFTILGLDAGR